MSKDIFEDMPYVPFNVPLEQVIKFNAKMRAELDEFDKTQTSEQIKNRKEGAKQILKDNGWS